MVGREHEQPVITPHPDANDTLVVEEAVLQLRQELVISGTSDRLRDAFGVEPVREHVLCEPNRALLRRVDLALQTLFLLLARDQDRDEADNREDRPEEQADPVASASVGLHVCSPTSLGTSAFDR